MMQEIVWSDFEKVELRVGTVVAADAVPEARMPGYKFTVDYGRGIGVQKSSAQIMVHHAPGHLNRVFYREDGSVVLAVPGKPVVNRAKAG